MKTLGDQEKLGTIFFHQLSMTSSCPDENEGNELGFSVVYTAYSVLEIFITLLMRLKKFTDFFDFDTEYFISYFIIVRAQIQIQFVPGIPLTIFYQICELYDVHILFS